MTCPGISNTVLTTTAQGASFGAFSVEALIKSPSNATTAWTSTTSAIVGWDSSGGDGFLFEVSSGSLVYRISTAAPQPLLRCCPRAAPPNALANNSWYDVAFTYSGTGSNSVSLYWTATTPSTTGASLLGTGNASKPLKAVSDTLAVGDDPHTTIPFAGLIDEVRIENVALSANQFTIFGPNPASSYNNWSGVSGGNWSVGGNWSAGLARAPTTAAAFGGGSYPATGPTTVLVNNADTPVGSLNFFEPTYKFTLGLDPSGSGSLSIGTAASPARSTSMPAITKSTRPSI